MSDDFGHFLEWQHRTIASKCRALQINSVGLGSGRLARNDVVIDRSRVSRTGLVYLVRVSCDEVVRDFQPEWTDEQILDALDFANAAYVSGFHNGQTAKVDEIRAALRIGR